MRKSSPLVIGIDADGVIINLQKAWLDWYNEKWDDDITLDEMVWDFHKVVKPAAGKKVYEFLDDSDIYDNMKPLAGALDGVRKLISAGHDVKIVTASSEPTIPGKASWLHRYLPEVKARDIMYLHPKELLRLDIFIDDSPGNIEAYRRAWPEAQILTLAYAYNDGTQRYTDLRAQSGKNPRQAWKEIVQHISDFADSRD